MTRNETSPPAAASADPSSRQRIAKMMARVGLCSRREAESWILDGRVSVNGQVLASPALDVGPDDTILVDGAPLPSAEKSRLFLFHKPRGLVTSDHDPDGRPTVTDYLHEHWPEGPRVVTIGRLDINTEGLLLLTNDGGLARILELPKTGWVRKYRVRAKGETDQAVLDSLRDGVSIDGIDYAGIEATLDRTQGANVWLTMGLREGKNREVKRVLEHIGLEVNRLIRLSFGPFQLADLPEGAVEEVRTRVLRDQLGPTLAAEAGVAFDDAPPPQAADQRGKRTPDDARTRRDDARPRRAREDGKERPATRGGDRPRRRPTEPPPPIRERPQAGPRKHVSTIRAAESDAARHGPRRRIERTDVTVAKDRTVRVERLVDARPAPLEPTRPRKPRSPGRRDAAWDEATPQGRKGGRTPHASPSAMAKRARVARSSGEGGRPGEDRRRDERPAPRAFGGKRRDDDRNASGHRAERGTTRREPARGSERPRRPSEPGRGERPARAPRDREAGGAERRGTERPARGPRPEPRGGKGGPRPPGRPERGGPDRSRSGGGRGDGAPRKPGGGDRRPPRGPAPGKRPKR